MNRLSDTYTLSNGHKIPCIGFGTWQTPDGETATTAVRTALKTGYRHVDCAAVYGNEISVGKGIKEGLEEAGLKREEIFVTSKLWLSDFGYDNTLKGFEKTLKDLGLEYLDLYLIHWPADPCRDENWDEINLSSWKAMTELYKAGRIKSIGLSNFHIQHMKSLMETEVKPMVDQIEFHPGFMQEDTVEYCRANNILVEGWSPLGCGRMLSNELLLAVAEKYNVTVAQLCIRWAVQNGVLPLPKSKTPERIIDNTNIWGFEISDDDMVYLNGLPYIGGSGLIPEDFHI